ncbi:MAG: hypothetical protein KIT09_31890 [Bryobacteraceae bacterium]|nr:hypothetical protein [Bryobacteraceae bacterium]
MLRIAYDAIRRALSAGLPSPHDRIITDLVDRLQAIEAPRSLVELRVTGAEYEALLRWGGSLSRHRVRADLLWGLNRYCLGAESWAANEFVGLGLFILITEIARRYANEGQLWPSVVEYFPQCRDELFTRNAQPAPLLKDGLETAARKARLRHVFGSTGTQEWYLSVYLQFGFTASGIKRIPYWLAGYPRTASISILLGEDQHFPGRAAGTFQELWALLQQVRDGNRKPEHAKHLLMLCPFILPEWIESVLAQAQKHVETIGHESQTGPILLFEAPFLKWAPGCAPLLATRVTSLAWANLDPVPHRITVDGQPSGYIAYSTDGHHTTSGEVALPHRTGSCIIELETDGRSVYQQELELWSVDEDVTAFRSFTGKRIDAYRDLMRTGEPFYVATAPDINLLPEPAKFHRDNTLPVHFYELRPPWPPQIRAALEGHDVWSPRTGREPAPEPAWLKEIRIVPTTPGNARVDAPPPTVIRQVRVGRATFPPDGIQYGTLPPKPHYTITINAECRNQRGITRRALQVEPPALERVDNEWRKLTTLSRITAAEAEQLVIKLSPASDDELYLMAGHVLIKRLTGAATRVGRVTGFGESLAVFSGRFNGAHLQYQIAKTLEDTGIIVSAQHNFGVLIITTQHQVNLTPEHSVHILGVDGSFTSISGGDINVTDRQWWLRGLSQAQMDGWIAIKFRGERLGAIWPPVGPLRTKPLTAPLSAEMKAAFLRWFRVPICASDVLPYVRQLLHSRPQECLGIWLNRERFELPDGHALQFGNDAGEEWWAAVREACWAWRHRARGVSDDVLSAVSGRGNSFTAGCALIKRADPLLAYRILRPILLEDPRWLSDLEVTLPGEAYLRMLREESQTVLRADAYFLDDLVRKAYVHCTGGMLRKIDEDNLKIALHGDAFRQYVFMRMCKDHYASP